MGVLLVRWSGLDTKLRGKVANLKVPPMTPFEQNQSYQLIHRKQSAFALNDEKRKGTAGMPGAALT
jgi:hypothetical protein